MSARPRATPRHASPANLVVGPAALLALLLGAASAASAASAARAAEPLSVEIETMNDALTATDSVDDLYTAGLEVRVSWGAWSVALEETLFTDRAAGIRFDETWLVGSWLPRLGPWRARLSAGAMRVGEGLLGQDFQNFIHRLVGFDELDLAYLPLEDEHAVVGAGLERSWPVGGRVELGPWLEARQAFDHTGHVAAGGSLRWRVSRIWTLAGRAGGRLTDSELPALDRRLDESEPVAALSLTRKGWIRATYGYNDYGTGAHHWHLAFAWRAGPPSPEYRGP